MDLDERRWRQNAHEPIRLKLLLMAAKIDALLEGEAIDYDARAYRADLALIADALHAAGLGPLADEGSLADVRVQADAFGFHLAALDLRQHSRVHEEAVAALLAHAGVEADYAALDEEARVAVLTRELENARPLAREGADLGESAASVLGSLAVAREAGEEALNVYIISMTDAVSDVLEVLLLAKEAGLWRRDASGAVESQPRRGAAAGDGRGPRRRRGAPRPSCSRTPSMPRTSAPEAACRRSCSATRTRTRTAATSRPTGRCTRRRARSRGRAGARAWRCGCFTGAAGRSGAAADARARPSARSRTRRRRAKSASPSRARSSRSATRSPASRTATWSRSSTPSFWRWPTRRRRQRRTCPEDVTALMDRLADRSMTAYRDLVDAPDFWPWYLAATPIEHIAGLSIASRPVSRKGAATLDFAGIRAIPWVFAWTQPRMTAPGWFGAGTAFAEALSSGDLDRLRALHDDWLFFRAVVANARRELGRARFPVSRRYNALGEASGASGAPFETVEMEASKTEMALLRVSTMDGLLEDSRAIAATVRYRNPATDVLNLAQIELMRRWREIGGADASPEASGDLQTALFLSINGIAAAMQSTG